jgi:hypothetical protein
MALEKINLGVVKTTPSAILKQNNSKSKKVKISIDIDVKVLELIDKVALADDRKRVDVIRKALKESAYINNFDI